MLRVCGVRGASLLLLPCLLHTLRVGVNDLALKRLFNCECDHQLEQLEEGGRRRAS